MSPKIISLFSGCGGLDYGFHLEGYQTVWANDFFKPACKTFARNISNVITCQDISEIDPYTDTSIPECDLIVGGFPCQDFSIVWKQPGLDGSRGGLFRYFAEFVDSKKPKAFVAENVKGLITTNQGKALDVILKDFESISPGYIVKPYLYNFAKYGVPQFRERLLIVGIRLDTGFNFIHPAPSHGVIGGLPYITSEEALKDVDKVENNNEHMKIKEKTREYLKLIPEGGNFSNVPKSHPLYVKSFVSLFYRRLKRDEPAYTVVANGGGGTWSYHYTEPRPLTNRERARLQSFPDDFVFEGNYGDVRKQIGNAVPPAGIRELAKKLLPLFSNNYNNVDLITELEKLKNMNVKQRIKYIKEETENQ